MWGIVIALLVLAAAVTLWTTPPVRAALEPRALLAGAERLRDSGWGLLLIPPAFVLLSLVLVPSSVLRWTTIVAIGPVSGLLCMALGVIGATLVGHAIGQRLGSERLARLAGTRLPRIRDRLQRTGVLGIAALRQVPLGPFMVVNAVAGAARVRRHVLVAGTLVAMVPSVIVMTIAGGSLRAWLAA